MATLTPRNLWEYTDISSCSLYAGGLVFVFAVFSILVRPRSRLRWALFAGIALAIAASLAHALPLRGWLYDWVPPTRYFRHASWFRAYAIFLLGLLALLGIRDFVNGVPGVNRKRRLMAAATFSVIVAGAAYWAVLARAHPANHTPGDIHFFFAWAGPALVVAWLRPSRLAQSRWWVPTAFCLLAVTDAGTSSFARCRFALAQIVSRSPTNPQDIRGCLF